MKTIYSLLLLCIGFSGFSQIVNIPDVNFKNALLNHLIVDTDADSYPDADVDTNNNGEIEVIEAQAITNLTVDNENISSLTGIESFTNLISLRCSNNQLTSLNVSTLSSLLSLGCGYNQLTSLNVTALDLVDLYCSFNAITSLDLTSCTNLRSLGCNNNTISSLILPMFINLYPELYLSHNELTTIDLSHLGTVCVLDLSYNNLTSISFNNPNHTYLSDCFMNLSNNPLTSLDMSQIRNHSYNDNESLGISNTLLTEIVLPPAFFIALDITDNPNLVYINARNGAGDFWELDGNPDYYTHIVNNPQLSLICIDDYELPSAQQIITGNTINFTTYCSFTPGGFYNTITGTIAFDANNNGCSSSATAAVDLPIHITQSGNNVGMTATNSNGNYTTYLGNTSITLTPQIENAYFTITPATFVSSFVGMGNTQTVNFCITPNGVHPDLEVSIVPVTIARPGFDAQCKIVYKNKGNQIQSGTIDFTFEDAILDFVSANPVFNSQAASTLSWNFTDLAPFEIREILVTLNVNAPTETPPVNNGDILHYSAALTTTETDETPLDNQMVFNQIVVGSYDPNDKTCLEGNTINPSQIGDYLHYVIRFQNTGTYAAENVVVTDVLNPKLDWNTLEMVSSSHPFRSTLSYDKLEVFYENINLPASIDNEPASHGYIAFRIKPKSTVALNDVIENTANIYFDYNFPIVTNTVATEVAVLSTNSYSQSDFSLYPNPAKNTLTIDFKNKDVVYAVTIYNTIGQIVQSFSNDFSQQSFSIDVSVLNRGTYFITVQSDNGKSTKKFIKL